MIKKVAVFTVWSSLLAVVLLSACVKKIGKNAPPASTIPVGQCDSVTYSKHIEPIVTAQCVTCHSPGIQSPDLTTYAGMKGILESGKLKKRVIDGDGGFMPPSGKLPQNEIDLIQCWIDNGGKEQ